MKPKRDTRLPATARRLELAAAAAALSLLAACGGGATETVLTSSRTYEPVGRDLRWGATDAERFGISAKDFAKPSGGAGMDDDHGTALHYSVPAGWSELPPQQFREVNLRVAGDERAECYLTTLSGEGGGLEANVNRWRRQVSQPALSAAEVAALPRVTWLGKPAAFVDFEGTWTGMSGSSNSSDWRLVGLLLVDPMESRFLKMVGPRDVIAKELEAFKAFAASFFVDDGMPEGHPKLPDTTQGAMGAAGPKPATTNAASGGTREKGVSGEFDWTVPAGWSRGAEKTMREVTYTSGTGGTECYVTLLGGEGGGLLANINRWCGQLGATAFAENELATLPHETMLGSDAVVVEISRGEKATAPANQELLLGALCIRPDRSVFVKMVGPRAEVQAEREAFLEFCRSIRTTR